MNDARKLISHETLLPLYSALVAAVESDDEETIKSVMADATLVCGRVLVIAARGDRRRIKSGAILMKDSIRETAFYLAEQNEKIIAGIIPPPVPIQ